MANSWADDTTEVTTHPPVADVDSDNGVSVTSDDHPSPEPTPDTDPAPSLVEREPRVVLTAAHDADPDSNIVDGVWVGQLAAHAETDDLAASLLLATTTPSTQSPASPRRLLIVVSVMLVFMFLAVLAAIGIAMSLQQSLTVLPATAPTSVAGTWTATDSSLVSTDAAVLPAALLPESTEPVVTGAYSATDGTRAVAAWIPGPLTADTAALAASHDLFSAEVTSPVTVRDGATTTTCGSLPGGSESLCWTTNPMWGAGAYASSAPTSDSVTVTQWWDALTVPSST